MRERMNGGVIDRMLDRVTACPWSATAGAGLRTGSGKLPWMAPGEPLYSPQERARRDASPWTLVQGILAPAQFVVFAVSLYLVVRYLETGEGFALATASIVAKTLILYVIMVTGAIWEKVVFGKYLFARAFFWEDVFSMLVLALHTAYLVALFTGWGTPREQMVLALAAYGAYVINAAQFVLKLRAARKQGAAGGGADALVMSEGVMGKGAMGGGR